MLTELGNELNARREELQLSLEAVARPAGISAAYLCKLEQGKVTTPSPHVLWRLSRELDVKYLRLMELSGYLNEEHLAELHEYRYKPHPHPLANQQLTPDEWRAVGTYISMLLVQRDTGG